MGHRRQTARSRCSCVVTAAFVVMYGAALEAAPAPLALRIVGGLPEPDTQPVQWRVLVLVSATDKMASTITPLVEIERGRLLDLRPRKASESGGRSAVFFIRVEATNDDVPPSVTFSVKEAATRKARRQLALGVDLSRLDWQAWWQGKDVHVGDVKAPPPSDAGWRPTVLPRLWHRLGVTWVRTRVTVPTAWRGKPMRIEFRAIDDHDATFLNAREIGRTNGWDRQRRYDVPADLVRWGKANELCVAVDNVNAGGGVYRAPLLLSVGDDAAIGAPFAPAILQPEARRAPPRPIGPRLPLRPMAVRDGVLCYEDGKEVALWGVNTYPQSWTQFNSLKKLGIDPKRATDEDFEDFVQMGIEIIRIHVFDTEISDGRGNLIRNDHLDVLDYLVAKCNKANIALMLTPIAWWGSPNQRPDSFSRNTPKQAMSMWPDRWPAQTRYLQNFLTHENPYTHRRLVDEPCLVLFEIINEPTYWSYGDVRSRQPGLTHVPADVAKRGLHGVRAAWHAFAPSPEWRSPAAFACFRYETLRRYIDTMIEAIRSTGARQPIAYSTFDSHDVDIAQAVADSRCDAITLGAYPGGLRTINDDKNLLGEAANGALDSRFAKKARLVYEFDAAGMARQVCMYPAMARRWRNLGVQVACMFQYDARSLAHLNWDWSIHYLNLWHTPGKIVSFLIGGEAFRRIPRGAAFSTPPDDPIFGPAAVSFRRNVALLSAPDTYMQTGPTDWRPLPVAKSPRRVMGVGTCPHFEYDGTGVVDLRIDATTAHLRIYPDVERLRTDLQGTVAEPLTRLHEREHPFRLRLPGWADTKVERREGDAWKRVPGCAAEFRVKPGAYRLR